MEKITGDLDVITNKKGIKMYTGLMAQDFYILTP